MPILATMLQRNLFAIMEANFFLKLAMQALPARASTQQPAFPTHCSSANAPE